MYPAQAKKGPIGIQGTMCFMQRQQSLVTQHNELRCNDVLLVAIYFNLHRLNSEEISLC